MPMAIPIRSMAESLMRQPDVRGQVLEMHAAQMPLADMCEALGLGDELTPDVRAILEGLSPETVAGIRQAIVDWVNGGAGNLMPINCTLDGEVPTAPAASVAIVDSGGTPTIEVTPIMS